MKGQRFWGDMPSRSIFQKLLTTLLLMLAAEVLLLVGAVLFSRVIPRLNENEVDLLVKQVENRTTYVERWMQEVEDLNLLTAGLNSAAQELLDAGSIQLETLDQSSEAAAPLLEKAAPLLVSTLRTKSVNGIFVILSSHDLGNLTEETRLPSIYLRDLDPDATPSERNADLLVMRGSSAVVRQLGISTDKNWKPVVMAYPDGISFFVPPYQAAYTAERKLEAEQYGYWTTEPFALWEDDHEAIAYIQPLILPNGQVYGVVGVELLVSYMEKQLPSAELQKDSHGTYFLVSADEQLKNTAEVKVHSVIAAGERGNETLPETMTLTREGENWKMWLGDEKEYACIRELSLYSRNAPFSGQKWLLMGTVSEQELFSFTHTMQNLFLAALAAIVVVGVWFSLVMSSQLSRPVARLSQEVERAREKQGAFPEFSYTGIRELDQFASAITELSQQNRTAELLERRRIEHERDYDMLTGLYNRQAFYRVCSELFARPEKLGCAALMMADLDNLKRINDTYGHDWGDRYLRQTGRCLLDNTPTNTLCSRLSGDEFLLLFYGFRDKDEIRAHLQRLKEAVSNSSSTLPGGNELSIRMSAGVAWYPDDSADYETLKKYADFAMYQVKRSCKGEMVEFDFSQYKQEAHALRLRRDFEEMLSDRVVPYHFQPIFDAETGKPVAYEALMRPQGPTLTSPLTVMKLARELGRLYDIEYITLFNASEAFCELRRKGEIDKDALLFINSVANVSLTDEDWTAYRRLYGDLTSRIVVEITEEEEMDTQALERKRTVRGASGRFALDDYGSGYSNGNSLLTLAPHYVKVDISIIRNIDLSVDKQQFLTSLVEYARPRGIKVLAEGVETTRELRKVLELGVDLLQGYALAKPAAHPAPIDRAARRVIDQMRLEKKIEQEHKARIEAARK